MNHLLFEFFFFQLVTVSLFLSVIFFFLLKYHYWYDMIWYDNIFFELTKRKYDKLWKICFLFVLLNSYYSVIEDFIFCIERAIQGRLNMLGDLVSCLQWNTVRDPSSVQWNTVYWNENKSHTDSLGVCGGREFLI